MIPPWYNLAMAEDAIAPGNRTDTGRNPDGTFAPGVSGNPSGRPKNTMKDYISRKFQEMSDEDKEAWLRENRISGIDQWKMGEGKSIAELAVLGVNVIPCTKGPDSVMFGIKHVQALRISYTATSKNLKDEYESYAWKRNKSAVEEDDHLGMEDPKCANHSMSAARYFLTEMVKANADPEAEARLRERAARQVAVTKERLTQNGAR